MERRNHPLKKIGNLKPPTVLAVARWIDEGGVKILVKRTVNSIKQRCITASADGTGNHLGALNQELDVNIIFYCSFGKLSYLYWFS